jgi:N-methylhydantoinase A
MVQLADDMSKAARRTISPNDAAHGVISVVNTNMERALRRISVERGYDSRDFALLPFGGAGGLHAVELAQALRIPQIIVPKSAGALSAIGVIAADVVKDQSHTIMLELRSGIEDRLERAFREMERSAGKTLRSEGFTEARRRHERSLALRYKGQSFELEIPYTGGNIAAAFHRAHMKRYGYAQESSIIEVVSARVRSSGLTEKIAPRRAGKLEKKFAKARRFVQTTLAGGEFRAGVYERENLLAGEQLRTPCIVIEYSSTTLIPAGVSAVVDRYGNLIIEMG